VAVKRIPKVEEREISFYNFLIGAHFSSAPLIIERWMAGSTARMMKNVPVVKNALPLKLFHRPMPLTSARHEEEK
jgi:hypothetical protein